MSARSLRMLVWLAPLLLITPLARAASINYGDYTSVNPGDVDFLRVVESTISDVPPLFGAPTRLGNSLVFSPLLFASSSADGSADTTSGTLKMRIRADDGFSLPSITIIESGSYSLTGSGTHATSATINGLLTLTDIVPGTHTTLTSTLSVLPFSTYYLPGDVAGNFIAVTHIGLSGLGISELVLNFNNNLQTSSELGTTALIQKKHIRIDTPEPATLSFLVIGAVALRARRIRR